MDIKEKARQFVSEKPYFKGLDEEEQNLLIIEIAFLLLDIKEETINEMQLKLFGK